MYWKKHILEASLDILLQETSTTPYLGFIGGKACVEMCTVSTAVAWSMLLMVEQVTGSGFHYDPS